MANYTPVLSKQYPEGFVNAPPKSTPITAEILNNHEDAIAAIEEFLKALPDIDLENLTISNSISLGRKADTDIGEKSIAEGDDVTANKYCAHAEGYETTASGAASHAEGYNTTASGSYSHAEGRGTKASLIEAHAEGYYTTASGADSHAEGERTLASGSTSHAEGYKTIASGDYSHVQGKYNIEDTENKYAHIVGNGNYSASSNAHTLDWYGNAWFAGDVYIGGTGQDDENVKKLATEQYVLDQIAELRATIEELNNKLNSLSSTASE